MLVPNLDALARGVGITDRGLPLRPWRTASGGASRSIFSWSLNAPMHHQQTQLATRRYKATQLGRSPRKNISYPYAVRSQQGMNEEAMRHARVYYNTSLRCMFDRDTIFLRHVMLRLGCGYAHIAMCSSRGGKRALARDVSTSFCAHWKTARTRRSTMMAYNQGHSWRRPRFCQRRH